MQIKSISLPWWLATTKSANSFAFDRVSRTTSKKNRRNEMEKPTLKYDPGSLEVVITHKFDAPRDLVYKIYVDPGLIPEWWGPKNLTTVVDQMEVIPGGIWRYIQTDPQRNVFAFHGVYHSLEPYQRIVSTFEWEGMPGHVCFVTTSFEERDGKTIVTQQNIFQSVQDRDGMIQQGMEQGMVEGDERFNELLDKLTAGETIARSMLHHAGDGTSISITRIFDAPRERVWQEWTNPDLYMCWWGPKDFTAPYARFDLHEGGKFLSCMRGPDGKDYWDTGIFREIREPNRIVYTDSFADEKGNVVPASYYGFKGDTPLEMEVELTLEDVGGKTRLTLEHCGFTDAEMASQAREGWGQSFDKLSSCLG
jgi:uncharacterized protein YndB with AHSA1/START domain